MQGMSLEREIWMMRADLRTVIYNMCAARVRLSDIEDELWKVNETFCRSGQSCVQQTQSE